MNEIIKQVSIKRTTDAESAYAIAEMLTDYFDAVGLRNLKQDTKSHLLYGAYLGVKMVGFANYKELNPQAVELAWLGVLPEYQDKGIGSKLVLESLQQAGGDYKVCEVKTLAETHPDPGYQRTRKFYARLGFVSIEIIDPYPGWSPDSPCQILIKCLSC